MTRKLWQAVIGVDPSLGAVESGGAVERVNVVDAAVFANALSRREGRAECYAIRCHSLADEGPARVLSASELVAALGEKGGCRLDTPWCISDRRCAVVRRPEACGYRLPTENEWARLLALDAPGSELGRLAELVWPERAQVTHEESAMIQGASWLSDASEARARSAPMRVGLRAFNVGFRLVLDSGAGPSR